MAENPTMAFLQQALSVSGPNAPVEETALYNLFMQRLIAAGMTIDASGNITAPFIIANPNVTNATGTLPANHGGTGLATLTAHGVVVGEGTSAVAGVTGTTGQVLKGVTGADPAFAQVVLTTDVIGTLPVANGGTGLATLTTAYGLITAGTTAAGTPQTITPGAAGTTLRSGGAAAVPTWVANGAPVVFALTDGATPALDASLGTVFTLVAAGNRTIAVPSNATDGQKIIIRHQASGGARTLALNSGAGGFRFGTDITALSSTTSAKWDYIGCVYNGTDSKWDVVAYVKGF